MRDHRTLRVPYEVRESWTHALASGGHGLPLSELYKGAYWFQATALARGLGAELAVVSAGLGLVMAGQCRAPYSATFSPGHEDSVPEAGTADGRRRWWTALEGDAALQSVVAKAGLTIVVLPNRYLEVVTPDLLASRADQLLVFAATASSDLVAHLGPRLVRLESRMVRNLATNVGALAPAAARHLLIPTDAPWEPSRLQSAAKAMVSDAAPPLYPVRRRQTEDQVRNWLEALAATSALPASATAALRQFRDDGRAYEQKRFHRLYHAVVSDLAGAA